MTLGSLFSGVGGFELGLERAGFKTRWQVEIDPYARAVLKKHWPDVPKYTDVRKFCRRIYDCDPENEYGEVICPRCSVEFGECDCIGTDQLIDECGTVDCICGGFPCQPFSRIGKQEGVDDTRWLWPEYARVVNELRPIYVVMENPAGILDGGLGLILCDLASMGYSAEWGCFPASCVGAPHPRDRIYLVAYSERERLEGHPGDGKIEGEKKTSGSVGARCLRGRTDAEGWWKSEPDVGRMAHGIPNRVDRIKCLGNAVVPQVAEWIGRCVMEFEKEKQL